MGLIIIQGRSPIVIGGSSRRGVDGVSVASVGINEDKHLIITLTNGVTHDAGQLPSSAEVEALARQLQAITERVKALEDGAVNPDPDPEPEIPENALAGPGGGLLVSASGKYLVFAANAGTTPANALTHQNGELLTNSAGQILTSGEAAV
ncbi:hypothetical protein ACYCFL_05605 [Stutzerimonas nitrititolerans]|uniref:hypothetical protein n=1 Tax=Stutzerimonas nitrititolerans TaxID=2482751 RepID=UPI0028A1B68F|nr:hypothetical protein [Stutzerimonas nitrititolerans]